jgi:hypothetical protein
LLASSNFVVNSFLSLFNDYIIDSFCCRKYSSIADFEVKFLTNSSFFDAASIGGSLEEFAADVREILTPNLKNLH